MSQRAHVLGLYRSLLRIGTSLAERSPNHSLYVLRRAKEDFKANALLADPEEIRFAVALAETSLDSLAAASRGVDSSLGRARPSPTRRALPVHDDL